MSTKAWVKNNQFYFIFAAVLIVVAIVVIYAYRSIFSSVSVAYEVSVLVPDSELRIDKDKLYEAHSSFYEKEVVPLKTR